MVTCKNGLCRKWANLDADGYCPTHTRSPDDSVEEEQNKCGDCNELVENGDEIKALQCDAEKCKLWYHLRCTKISEALYDLMNANSKDNDDGIRWLCPKCTGNERVIDIVEKSSNNEAPICSRLKHGTCPHGISGKTEHRGKVCEFRHPKFCKKFVRNGNGGRFGCKAGKNCEFFHPVLCKKSVQYRKCLDHKCTYVHLKGTARKERIRENFPPSPSDNYLSGNRFAALQQSQWYRNDTVPIGYQSPQNQITQQRREKPFLGRPVAPQPSVELSSLQVQVDRLEEMIKSALGINSQPQTSLLQKSSQLQDQQWGSQRSAPHLQNY